LPSSVGARPTLENCELIFFISIELRALSSMVLQEMHLLFTISEQSVNCRAWRFLHRIVHVLVVRSFCNLWRRLYLFLQICPNTGYEVCEKGTVMCMNVGLLLIFKLCKNNDFIRGSVLIRGWAYNANYSCFLGCSSSAVKNGHWSYPISFGLAQLLIGWK
jgi:hypothetical protein